MFDLDGFLSVLDEIDERRRTSVVPLLRQSKGNDAAGVRPRQKPGPKPGGSRLSGNRSGGNGLRGYTSDALRPEGAGKPRTGGKPVTGTGPVAAFEDERRKQRGGTGGGGAGTRAAVNAGSPARSSALSQASSPGQVILGSDAALALCKPQVRVGIASGSQQAVVKLVSFAAGRSRIGALLNYQSREGKLPVEDEAGLTQDGNAWVQAMADDWSEEDGRQPSKDVLRLSLTVPASSVQSNDDLSWALKQALPGHRIAWRSEEAGERRHIALVVSAAARKQPGETTPVRIFETRKSLSQMQARFIAVFGGEAEVDVQGFAHGVEGVARYLGQIRQGGRHDLHSIRLVDRSRGGSAGYADDVVLTGPKAAIEEARSWKRDLRSQERRDVAHIVLSAKPGTPREAFVAASRAMLAREFAGHAFVFALHEDRDHLHVHVVVKMRSETGKKLHPKIQDFKRWRETLAEEARQRNIPMDAVSRFERANPPGYTMKDIRRVERGEASETVRRRVEAARAGDVHVPTRIEGRRRAEAVAQAWSDTSRDILTSTLTPEPPQLPGLVRLYRAERAGSSSSSPSSPQTLPQASPSASQRSSAPLFTRDRAAAAQMVIREGGALMFLDIPATDLHRLVPSRTQPDTVFVVPRVMASEAQTISPAEPAEFIRFRERTARAAAGEQQQTSINSLSNQKDNDMADLSLMKHSFKAMDDSLDQIMSNLPEDKVGAIKALRDKVSSSQRVMLDAQEAIEKKRGRIEGETFVSPQPVDLMNFVAERRGEILRYSHRKADGRSGSIAFTDHGDKVEITNWNDREIVLAAMQVASTKWGSLTINGTDRYKAMAIELAVEHGFQITNPELQSSLELARQQFASRREKAGIAAGSMALEHPSNAEPAAEPNLEMRKVTEPVTTLKPIDDGQKIRPAEREREAMLAAMRQAEAKWGVIAVNGTERDKAMAVELAAEYGMTLTNPELQEKLTEARRKVDERRQRETERESKRLGFVEGSVDQISLRKSDAEIEIALASVRDRTETEARREVRQASNSSSTNERPFDGGGEDHNYRTQSEATAAVRAERAVTESLDKPIAPDINQSPEIAQERQVQEKLLAERQAYKDEKARKQTERQTPKNRQ